MPVHIEAQSEEEVRQVRSRELQLESVEKLNNMIPIVNTLDNVDLEKVEKQTDQIKEIVNQNLEEQPNIEEITKQINALTKEVKNLKKSATQLKKTLSELKKILKEINEKIE